jgi:hypothetical protein
VGRGEGEKDALVVRIFEKYLIYFTLRCTYWNESADFFQSREILLVNEIVTVFSLA